jgi:polysaccharide export outer membrane protein
MFFQKIKKNILILLLLIFQSCNYKSAHPPRAGVDELVEDSYKISNGKNEILEMMGYENTSLDPSLLIEDKEYLENSDVLNISIYHPKRKDLEELYSKLSNLNEFTIKDYNLTLPNLDPIDVKDLNIKDLNKKIENIFKKEIEDIKLLISYKSKKIKEVSIAGLSSISSLEIKNNTRLFDLVTQVKIPISANLFKSYILRDNKFLAVDFYKLIKEGDMSYNIFLKDKDKIYISQESSNAYVIGEVKNPNVINLTNGFMPIKEAIAKSGGITANADGLNIQIIRGSLINPKIYILSFRHVLYLRENALLLMPGDIIYVSAKPIITWNRFITQLLPTIGIVDSAVRGFKNLGLFINE